jgi:hypothetical protein
MRCRMSQLLLGWKLLQRRNTKSLVLARGYTAFAVRSSLVSSRHQPPQSQLQVVRKKSFFSSSSSSSSSGNELSHDIARWEIMYQSGGRYVRMFLLIFTPNSQQRSCWPLDYRIFSPHTTNANGCVFVCVCVQ